MRILTVNVKESHIKLMEALVKEEIYPSRSEVFRSMVSDWISLAMAKFQFAKENVRARDDPLLFSYIKDEKKTEQNVNIQKPNLNSDDPNSYKDYINEKMIKIIGDSNGKSKTITINLQESYLRFIDKLVEWGIYRNRSVVIRTMVGEWIKWKYKILDNFEKVYGEMLKIDQREKNSLSLKKVVDSECDIDDSDCFAISKKDTEVVSEIKRDRRFKFYVPMVVNRTEEAFYIKGKKMIYTLREIEEKEFPPEKARIILKAIKDFKDVYTYNDLPKRFIESMEKFSLTDKEKNEEIRKKSKMPIARDIKLCDFS